jgi:hypothetical protein
MEMLKRLPLLLSLAGVALAIYSVWLSSSLRGDCQEIEWRVKNLRLEHQVEVNDLRRELNAAKTSLQNNDQSFAYSIRASEFPWTINADGRIGVRLVTDHDSYPKGAATVRILSQVKNMGTTIMHVPIPEVMPYAGVTVRGPSGLLQYIGPAVSRPPPDVVELMPGRIVKSFLELPMGLFKGMEMPGKYTLSYTYSPQGTNSSESFEPVPVHATWQQH